MKFQALRPATLLKSDTSKDVFLWILRGFKNTHFVEYQPAAASESVKY